MQYKTILRFVGLLLMMFSLSMLPPMLINVIFEEGLWMPFAIPFALIATIGGGLWLRFKHYQSPLRIREGFLIVVIIWFMVCFFASLPFILYPQLHHTFTDAMFETVSGITTTGAACFNDLERLPHAILYYHQQLQFIGGMGIVVLAVAILPILGTGGMELFKVESAGPVKDNKLTPRIAQTAKTLWGIYCLLTIICAFSYWYSGMSWFDALGESFSTISTGGFTMHDAGFLFYKSQVIESIACVFMLIGAMSFTLHCLAFQKHTIKVYWQSEEFRYFITLFFVIIVLMIALLEAHAFFQKTPLHVIDVIFTVISVATTSGFTFYPFDNWPLFAPILLILMSMIGGCAGSTTGGFKMLRLLLISKQSKREFMRALHPQAILTIKKDQQTVPESILQSIVGFTIVYFGLFTLLVLVFMIFDNDFTTAFSAIAGGLANSGVGIGEVSNSFTHLNNPSKWLLIFAMITGRLEIFPLFILFTKAFWQK